MLNQSRMLEHLWFQLINAGVKPERSSDESGAIHVLVKDAVPVRMLGTSSNV